MDSRSDRSEKNYVSLSVVPLDLEDANEFVVHFHRHSLPVPGAKFCFGVVDVQGLLRGVCIVGRPVAPALDDGQTLEVTRCCVDGAPNGCSLLYARARSIAFSLGYARLITYTLGEEGGASLRAVGWQSVEVSGHGGKGWQNREGRLFQALYFEKKIRWEAKNQKSFLGRVTFPWRREGEGILCELSEGLAHRGPQTLVFRSDGRLDIQKSVEQTVLNTGSLKSGGFHFELVYEALEMECSLLERPERVPTRTQIVRALNTMVRSQVTSNGAVLVHIGTGAYEWGCKPSVLPA